MESNRAVSTHQTAPPVAGPEQQRAHERVESAVRGLREGHDRDRHFAFLFECYHRRVERFFIRKGFHGEDCLDLTQETFLGIYKGIDGFRREARFDTWLFSVASKVYLKRLRSQSAAKRSGDEVPVEETALATDATAAAKPQLDGVLAEETRRALAEAMAELPRQMRRCLELRVYQEMRYREIGDVLRVSAETVKTHIFQARKKLRARLGEIFGEGWDF